MRLVFFGLALGMIFLCVVSGAQLIEPSASNIHLHVGASAIIKVYVTNPNSTVQNISGWLGGDYPAGLVKFSPESGFSLTADQRNFTIMLNPKEEKTISIVVSSTNPKDPGYTITLDSNSTIDSSVKDSESIGVYLDYTPSFPGMELWSMAILVASAGTIFWILSSARNK